MVINLDKDSQAEGTDRPPRRNCRAAKDVESTRRLVILQTAMTILEALDILESAVLECKKRDINTPEVKSALELLEPSVRPQWVTSQFRHHALEHNSDSYAAREGQQQVLRATFPGIRNCVRELLGVRADAVARKFATTHDMQVRDEIERLLKDYGKLKEPWKFVAS